MKSVSLFGDSKDGVVAHRGDKRGFVEDFS